MEESTSRPRVSQFSPHAERLIKARQKSPTYLKIAQILQQEEQYSKPQLKERQNKRDDNRNRSSSFINYITRLFTEEAL